MFKYIARMPQCCIIAILVLSFQTTHLPLVLGQGVRSGIGEQFSFGKQGATLDLSHLLRLQELCLIEQSCKTPVEAARYRGRLSEAQYAESQVAATSLLSVVNAASFGRTIGPGAWITIRGTDLAGLTRTWTATDFRGNLLPIVLSGTSVRIGKTDAAIYYVSPTQINALIPFDTAIGPTTITVTSPIGPPVSTSIDVESFSPGLFMLAPENSRYVAAVFPDGSLAGKQGLFEGNQSLTRPLKAGQRVALFATGLGTTNPPIPPGQNFSDARLMNGIDFFHVTVGGKEASVEFVGAVSPGLYQINIVAPVLISGDYAVTIEYGSFRSQSGAMITIQGDPALSQLQTSPTPFSMEAYTTSLAPSTQSLQLVSTGEDFSFSLQSSASWLQFDSLNRRTPAIVRVSVDGRSLTPGVYSEQITVLAPGTASPSTTIPVKLTVSNTPQIEVPRNNLAYKLVTGYQSLTTLLNVISEAGPVDFTISKTGGDTWLSVPLGGRTPAAIRISLNSETRSPGTLTGGIRITPAGGGTPRDVTISLTIVPTAAASGPPQIVALDEDEVLWGRSGSFGFFGQNLDGATTVRVNPPTGITVDSVKSANSGRVNLNFAVANNASEGIHTISVTTPRGVSDAFPISIRRGKPQIKDFKPTIVNPGRFYSTDGFSGSLGAMSFGLGGVDLQGITDFVVDPSDGVEPLWSIATTSPTSVSGTMTVASNAKPGIRRLSIITAGGKSNELPFEVRAASPNAPSIANLTLTSTYISDPPNRFSPAAVNYSGKLDFVDLDGDITVGSKLILMADTGNGSAWRYLVIDDGSYLEQKGKASGTIRFSFQKTFSFFYNQLTGTVPILCMIQDGAGNLSNVLEFSVSTWQVAVF